LLILHRDNIIVKALVMLIYDLVNGYVCITQTEQSQCS